MQRRNQGYEGVLERKKQPSKKIADASYALLTSLKSVNIGYSENNGTQLQGYKPEVGFLGRQNYGGVPGLLLSDLFLEIKQIFVASHCKTIGW